MPHPLRRFSSTGLWLTLLLGTVLTSCATAPMMDSVTERAVPSNAMPMPAPQEAPEMADQGMQPGTGEAPAAPQSEPQMVRRAQMKLDVESVAEVLDQVEAIAQQHQGDIIGLQEQVPRKGGDRHTAFITLRVPQAQLNETLDSLNALGKIQSQSITAEDVSTQLVDYQARLKNLRQTEEMLLAIMKRAGDMADVLRVAQEVSTVRQSIETLDAQLANLQTQVAYSVVTVTVEETVPTLGTQTPAAEAIAITWQQATHSVSQFTVTLLKLLTWLAAYSPYILTILLAAWFYRHHHQATTPISNPASTDSSES